MDPLSVGSDPRYRAIHGGVGADERHGHDCQVLTRALDLAVSSSPYTFFTFFDDDTSDHADGHDAEPRYRNPGPMHI